MYKVLSNHEYEIGCDEAGRGCLSGPVVAAAVILGRDFENDIINDSKQLSEKKRNSLRTFIEENAKYWAIGIVWPNEIDEINILNASFLAMHRAIDQLDCPKDLIVVDGNRFNKYHDVPHECIIKGDSKYMNIAAASILAKTYRDEYMERIHEEFPMYDWKKNKGYPTKAHRLAIKEFGATPYHRMTFKLLPDQLSLDL
ncbi:MULTISPECIES: ribonuclease HII [Empedobacter]|uniref:Ribonuclease HII n=1 Tax=Empedobacter falsenii TaxID=343874 RepID=A0A7H9DUW4_9FLAO|nr:MULTISPECIES: ribonuclease HII [Empedobacter]MDM1041136.1 ribonuclease HII [Empedobacter brevis]MDM1134800.1 ribonuclease HII [Empedobacter sp. R750]QLL58984.1 ribonuclease HII [Empedobacter falsenii]